MNFVDFLLRSREIVDCLSHWLLRSAFDENVPLFLGSWKISSSNIDCDSRNAPNRDDGDMCIVLNAKEKPILPYKNKKDEETNHLIPI